MADVVPRSTAATTPRRGSRGTPWVSSCGDPDAPVRRMHSRRRPDRATGEPRRWRPGADPARHAPPAAAADRSRRVAATTPTGRVVHRLVAGGCALLAVAHQRRCRARRRRRRARAALGLTGSCRCSLSATAGAGLGRIGVAPEGSTLGSFAERVRGACPPRRTASGSSADLGRPPCAASRCSAGRGPTTLEAAAAGRRRRVVTSDLKHHVALDHLAAGGPALLDVAHWASEWPWLPLAERRRCSCRHLRRGTALRWRPACRRRAARLTRGAAR